MIVLYNISIHISFSDPPLLHMRRNADGKCICVQYGGPVMKSRKSDDALSALNIIKRATLLHKL